MSRTNRRTAYVTEPERLALASQGRNVWGAPFHRALAGIPCGCGCGSWNVPSGSAFDPQCLARINRGAAR